MTKIFILKAIDDSPYDRQDDILITSSKNKELLTLLKEEIEDKIKSIRTTTDIKNTYYELIKNEILNKHYNLSNKKDFNPDLYTLNTKMKNEIENLLFEKLKEQELFTILNTFITNEIDIEDFFMDCITLKLEIKETTIME